MAKLNTKVSIGSFIRGDSAVIPWSWKKKSQTGELSAVSLAGYKAALTVKNSNYDKSVDDINPQDGIGGAVKGYNETILKVDIDCDNPAEMSNIDPTTGEIHFHLPKQAMWLDEGDYNVDIVVENKASKWTTTVFIGTLSIIGHPTNRLTTDAPDRYERRS